MFFRIYDVNRYDRIDQRIVSNVKKYAQLLKRNNAFKSIDIDDIEQELFCEILPSLNKYDEQCGNLEHFVRMILKRRSINLLKKFRRKKRYYCVSSSENIDRTPYPDESFAHQQNLLEQRADVKRLLSFLPLKYKVLSNLLSKHTSVEAAHILNVHRLAVLRNLNQIKYLFHCMENSKERFLVFIDKVEKKMSKNLATIELCDVKELSKLSVCDLVDLNEQVTKLVNHTKELRTKLDDAFDLRFSETVHENLRKENKDTGTTKFLENGFQITAEVPKKVTWDSEKISEIIKTISEEKCKAIIKTTHVIDERKYAQLSPEDKNLFADARTVTLGKTKFKISVPEEEL